MAGRLVTPPPAPERVEAVVVGCGVIGLTTAIRLREAGFRTRIVTKALPSETTSAVAAAVWYPYKAYPRDRVLGWSRATLDALCDLARDPAAGCSLLPLVDLFETPVPDPWWKGAVRSFRRATAADLPPGYADGYVIEAPLAEPPAFLPYLERRFRAAGGAIDVRPEGLTSLDALAADGRLVVNCTGLGAAALTGDDALYPIRGQVVRVTNPGLRRSLADEYGRRAISYIIPRAHDCILGGVAEAGVWDLTPDPAVTATILRRCRELEPRLRDAEVLDVRVGLRPGRPAVRLELERRGPRRAVLHNYGHGGAGFTLCWGCADEALALARAFAATL